MATSLEKTGKTVLRWGLTNAVIYDIANIKAILFTKTRGKKPKKEIAATKFVFGEQEVKFNDKATRWLGV